MTPILFYDTETTGLPEWSKPSEDPCQPRVTQLAAELCDDDTGKVIASMDCIIRPDGWTIPDEVAQLTGITTDYALAVGIPMHTALMTFIEMWQRGAQRVGHNESFDMRMIRIELMRHAVYAEARQPGVGVAEQVPFADYWKTAPAFCTQSNSTRILNLPPTEKMLAAKKKGPKSPNLAEAYEFFTGMKLEGAHNAAVDVMASKAVYFGIKQHHEGAAA